MKLNIKKQNKLQHLISLMTLIITTLSIECHVIMTSDAFLYLP
jgi:hypothetical protein